MKAVFALISRNKKLFFKDRGMFFSALITPGILILLYATFLANVYRDSFVSAIPDHDYNLRQTDRWNGGRTACRGSSGSQLCDCDILRESYDGTGPGKRNKERF